MKHWILKVLSGEHEGAEIDLSPGETVIGSDDECDLVFDAPDVLSSHFSLQVSDSVFETKQVVEIEQYDTASIRLNGTLVTDLKFTARSMDVISIADLHIGIGYQDADWELVELPVPVHDSAQTETQTEAGPVSEEMAPSVTEKEPLDITETHSKRLPRQMKPTVKRFSIAVSLMLALAGGALIMPGQDVEAIPSQVKESNSPLQKEELQDEINSELALKEVEIRQRAGTEQWQLAGYVKNSDELYRLQNWADAYQKKGMNPFRFQQVLIVDDLIDGTKETLKGLGFEHVEVHSSAEPGGIRLQGQVTDIGHWRRILKQLKADMSGIQTWDDRVNERSNHMAPGFKIVNVNLGPHPFFMTSQGDRYFEGSLLPGNYQVEKIELSALYLRQNEELVRYQLVP